MVSWYDPWLEPDLATDLERGTRRLEAILNRHERRHLVTCSFCGKPALTWTPTMALCDECLDRQEGLD